MHNHTTKRPFFTSNSGIDVNQLIARDGWQCAYCQKFLTVDMMTVDHVIPTSRGGADVLENTVISCLSCNAQKSDMGPELYEHWLEVRNYIFNIAPHQVITYEPVKLVSPHINLWSVIALPCLWMGNDYRLLDEYKVAITENGSVVIKMTGDYATDVVFIEGALYEYYLSDPRWGRNS